MRIVMRNGIVAAGLGLGRAAGLSILLGGRALAQSPEPLPEPQGKVLLRVTGDLAVANRDGDAVFDRDMLRELPRHELRTHTVVTDGVKTFSGFYMRDLLDRIGAEGDMVTALALNDYVIDIPMTDFDRYDVLVATRMDGHQLVPSDKGPLWIVYPRDDHAELQDLRYDYRWVWQLYELEVQ